MKRTYVLHVYMLNCRSTRMCQELLLHFWLEKQPREKFWLEHCSVWTNQNSTLAQANFGVIGNDGDISCGRLSCKN